MSANRTRETTTTTGTGASITLNGAVSGHASYNEYYAGANQDDVEYTIEEGDDYEVGIGNFTAPNLFTRVTAYEKKESGTYTKSPGTFLSLSGGAEIFVGIPAEEIDDKASLTNDNTFTGTNTAEGFIKSAVSKIVASSANIVDVFVYDTRNDTDFGAWRNKTQNTSWYNETLNTSTRGAKRKFPEVALIVAETDTVTFYDATDPDVPMWMIFNGDSLNIINKIDPSYSVNSAKCYNGIISCASTVTGGSPSGYTVINLITDTSSLYRDTLGVSGGLYFGGVSKRNDGLGFSGSSSLPLLVNDNVNSADISTLSGSEIDPATGLPYPTSLALTDAGASIINYDGTIANQDTVVDLTGAISLLDGGIDESGFIVVGSSSKVYVFETTPTIDTALSSADYIFDTAGTSGPHISGTISSVELDASDGSGNALFWAGTDEGVFMVDYVSGGSGSVVSQINTGFSTGGLPGDIRGAWLANSKTIDRSVKANTLTENGTVTESVVETGAELKAYSGFSATNNITSASDTDWDTIANGALSCLIWFKSSGNTTVETMLSIANAGNTVRYNLTMDSDGTIDFTIDGATASITLSSTIAYDDGQWHLAECIRSSNTSHTLKIDGRTVATSSTDTGSITDTGNLPLAIGVDADGSSNPATTMSLSLVRLTAYAITDDQAVKIYNDEKWLFRENARATLSSASNSIQDLSFDEGTNKLDASKPDGTDTIIGLLPIATETTSPATSANHKAVSRVDDQLAIGTAAEAIFKKPLEEL